MKTLGRTENPSIEVRIQKTFRDLGSYFFSLRRRAISFPMGLVSGFLKIIILPDLQIRRCPSVLEEFAFEEFFITITVAKGN